MVNGTRAFLPILVEQDDGVIVNTSSVFGLVGMPYQSAYCASKFAVRGFTDALRQELRGTGVRAVTVHPGGIKTNIARNARVRKDPEGRGRSHEQMAADFEALLRTTPDKAAEIICRGVDRGRARILVGPGRLRLRHPGPGRAHPLLRRDGAAREAAAGRVQMTEPGMMEHRDVLIVGAGLSGIGAAHHLQAAFPAKTYAILEARDAIGGTWDLFRYPGVRSDSDMFTLGYRFRPWTEAKAIADGPSILGYVRATAAEAGIEQHIRYGHRVRRAAWSSEQARWTVEASRPDGETTTLTCGFLLMCSGYYRYDQGYLPAFPGIEDFGGQVVHPQHWPADLDYAGKRVVVIGSGATAVTLVPALAEKAEHVTMLQRSPTYILAMPAEDKIAIRLRALLGARRGYAVTRWKNVAVTTLIYKLSQRRPDMIRGWIRQMAIKQLPDGYDVDTHFKPVYNPWDQRLCLVPDGDLFEAIRDGRASVVTDRVKISPNGAWYSSPAPSWTLTSW